jgi:hypothetical protein
MQSQESTLIRENPLGPTISPAIVYCTRHTTTATAVAMTTARSANGHMNTPNIAMLVRVAKMPPAGVKPPYAQL